MKSKYKDYITEAYKKQNIARTVRTLSHMTDINDHNGALVFLAQQLNSSKYIEALKGIQMIHKAEGSMPSHIRKYRDGIYNELMKLAKRQYNPEEYKEIHGSF